MQCRLCDRPFSRYQCHTSYNIAADPDPRVGTYTLTCSQTGPAQLPIPLKGIVSQDQIGRKVVPCCPVVVDRACLTNSIHYTDPCRFVVVDSACLTSSMRSIDPCCFVVVGSACLASYMCSIDPCCSVVVDSACLTSFMRSIDPYLLLSGGRKGMLAWQVP